MVSLDRCHSVAQRTTTRFHNFVVSNSIRQKIMSPRSERMFLSFGATIETLLIRMSKMVQLSALDKPIFISQPVKMVIFSSSFFIHKGHNNIIPQRSCL